MDTKKKMYLIVFAGIVLIAAGVLLYRFSRPKESAETSKNSVTTTITMERVIKADALKSNDVGNFRADSMPGPAVVNIRYKSQPLDFVYEKRGFAPSVPHYVGTRRPSSGLDGLRIVCAGKECERQVITSKIAEVANPCPARVKPTIVKGDVVFSKSTMKKMRGNMRIIGNLYIEGVDYIKIPRNFMVIGDVYVIDSEGVTFMGASTIDGNIFVRGRSSIRALPRDVSLTGQIFI